MTLLSAARANAPYVLDASGLMLPAGMVDRDAVPGGGGALFGKDLFVGSVSTELSTHSPDIGTEWIRQAGISQGATNAEIKAGNQIGATAGLSRAAYYLNDTPPSADYYVRGVLELSGTHGGNNNWLLGRCHPSNYDCYYWGYQGDNDRLEAHRFVGGVPTGLYNGSSLSDDSYILEIRMEGDQIGFYLDGIEQTTVTDSGVTAANFAAVLCNSIAVMNWSSWQAGEL